MNLIQVIEKFMEEKDMTLVQVQEESRPRIDNRKMDHIKSNINTTPSGKTLKALARAFKVPIEEFVADLDPKYLRFVNPNDISTPQTREYTLEEHIALTAYLKQLDRW